MVALAAARSAAIVGPVRGRAGVPPVADRRWKKLKNSNIYENVATFRKMMKK
jgi:hypothetical protein